MTNFIDITFITAPLSFLMDYRYLTWTVSIGTLLWVASKRFFAFTDYYRLSIFFSGLTVLMGGVEIFFLLAWFILFSKDNLGIAFVVSLVGALPIVIPAVLILLIRLFFPRKLNQHS